MKKYSRMAILVILDALMFNASYVFAYLLRFNFGEDPFSKYFDIYIQNFVPLTVIKVLIFLIFGLYQSLWKYAGVEELGKLVLVGIAASLVALAYLELTQQFMPRSIYILTCIFDIILTGAVRVVYRYMRNAKGGAGLTGYLSKMLKGGRIKSSSEREPNRVMLVGAGDAGASIIRELKLGYDTSDKVVVAVDDDPAKLGRTINGVKIAGAQKDIRLLARRYNIDEIIIAIPSATRKQIQAIVNECNKTECKVKILPSLLDLINEKVSVSALREVNIEDLLGREPVKLGIKEISDYIEGRIIMVTGGGGSIGSELCRQIVKFKPRRLIVLDIYENTTYELVNELKVMDPNIELEVVIASVRDKTTMRGVFNEYKPHVIFHAAAHKHVPLMETNPGEAIANNILGTKIVVDLADEFQIEKFVMISTDKAVNPTNVMGATKRLAEMVVSEKSKTSKTAYAVVRFGNVLGSNGSVIPIFRKQIKNGGPVTVTDKEITRYFMTIPEAAQLVIQAGALTHGGEIFILDMGEPVKILDLAENMIKLSGYTPYEDIDIIITELRPGEKIHEELMHEDEIENRSIHDKIFIGKSINSEENLVRLLNGEGPDLETVVEDTILKMDEDSAKAWLHEYLPTYVEDKKKSVLRGIKINDE